MKTPPTQSGFALLMTLIVVGVVLSIGLTLLDVSIKQVRLSTNAKDSEIAFHAANAGMECARYVRNAESALMEIGDDINPICFGNTLGNTTPTDITGYGDGIVSLYDYDFTWGAAADRCTHVLTLVASSDITGGGILVSGSDVNGWIPGFPIAETFDCEAGSRCTIISVRGYNKPCSSVGTKGTVEREVLLQF